MIRDFELLDARRIRPNEFSRSNVLGDIYYNDDIFKKTLEAEDGTICAVLVWMMYAPGCYLCAFHMDTDMKPIYARELRKFMQDTIVEWMMERVETTSVVSDVLSRWHEFLGFTHEGVKQKYCAGKDFDMWGMVKGRDF